MTMAMLGKLSRRGGLASRYDVEFIDDTWHISDHEIGLCRDVNTRVFSSRTPSQRWRFTL